jgi:hypothetical protein
MGSAALLSSAAMALPTFTGVFTGTYHVKADSALGKAKCGACHVGTSKNLNPFGADLKKALAGKKTLTAAILKKVESKDSDKDGVKNGAELKKGTLPGDPKSK